MTLSSTSTWPTLRGTRAGIAAQFGAERTDLLDWALQTGDPLADAVVEAIHHDGTGVRAFGQALERFLRDLPVRPVLLATVYDPTFGDDTRNFLGVPARIARANHRRVNDVIRSLAERHGRLADVHAHFLTGDASWFTHTIEPSLVGASEVRRVFLAEL